MDILSDFIYIVIFGGLLIKGIIDFIRKQSPKPEEVLPPFDKTKQIKPVAHKNRRNKVADQKPIAATPPPLPSSNTETKHETPEIKETLQEEENNPIIQSMDDLKKAVIYSEILNRKY